MHHDVQEFVKKFRDGLLIHMVYEAINDIRMVFEDIGYNLLLFPIYQQSYQF